MKSNWEIFARKWFFKMELVDLFTPGCRGTCWLGRFPYLEPWVGCEHDCDFCFARFRRPVLNTLKKLHATFPKPAYRYEPAELIEKVRERVSESKIEIIRLSKYTDFFSPMFVNSGTAYEILKILLESKITRVIITTKGLPDKKLLTLLQQFPSKISYNIIAKPKASICLEKRIHSLPDRLEAAGILKAAGILTTIHMDPLIPGFEDIPKNLDTFLKTVKGFGINRAMFSLLLLNDEIIHNLESRLDKNFIPRILENYDTAISRRFLPQQEEAGYISAKTDVKNKSVESISGKLREHGFKFVLCGLKNQTGDLKISQDVCPQCDGKFYA